MVTAIWSAKESVLKAIRTGLRMTPGASVAQLSGQGLRRRLDAIRVTLDAPLAHSFQGLVSLVADT